MSKEDKRYRGYAAKLIAETVAYEPPSPLDTSDAFMAETLSRCVRPAKPDEYDAIREQADAMLAELHADEAWVWGDGE